MEPWKYLLGFSLLVLLTKTRGGGAALGKLQFFIDKMRRNFIVYHTKTATQQLTAAVLNGSAGVEVIVQSGGLVVYNVSLLDLYLPSDCGEKYVYCGDILVTSVGPWSARIFIPLNSAFCVVDATVNDTISFAHSVVAINRECSPVAFFKMLNSVFAVCLNLQTNYFNILSIDLDSFQVQDVFSQPQYQIGLRTPLQISNFIVPDMPQSSAPSDQVLYITSGSDLYTILPLAISSNVIGTLPDCMAGYTLTYSDNDVTLLASCYDSTVYFDLQGWQILNITAGSINGYQYICQGANTRLIAIPIADKSVELNVTWWDSGTTSSLYLDTNFPKLGLCFQHGSLTNFAYMNDTGVFLTSITSASATTAALYRSQCLGEQQYDRLEVFIEMYLLVHQECGGRSAYLIIDTSSVSVQIASGDLMVLFELAALVPQPTLPASIPAPFPSNSTQFRRTNESVGNQKLIMIITATVVSALIIGTCALLCILIWYWCMCLPMSHLINNCCLF